jgi:folate-binding protein YgfZ
LTIYRHSPATIAPILFEFHPLTSRAARIASEVETPTALLPPNIFYLPMTTTDHTDSTPALVELPSPQILEISGADALAFAQAQFSSNLDTLARGHWQWSAWLSAQGRVRAFFHLLRDDDDCLRLILRGGSANALRDALSRYVLRAKASLRTVDDIRVLVGRMPAIDSKHAKQLSACRILNVGDEILIALPGAEPRWLALRDSATTPMHAEHSQQALNENMLADIQAGIPVLASELEDKLLPTWLGLDALGATSTDKGCYPGQEIVARLHFKGGNKRWPHRIVFSSAALPLPGTVIGDPGLESGLVVCSAWTGQNEGIALAILSETAASDPARLSCSTLAVKSAERIHIYIN